MYSQREGAGVGLTEQRLHIIPGQRFKETGFAGNDTFDKGALLFPDAMIAYIKKQQLTVEWILETHAHADHLSSAHYLREQVGGKIAIGEKITQVQGVFKKLFNLGDELATDGHQFDHLFKDGEIFNIGNLTAKVMLVAGHTPADVAYMIEDAVFIGD